ncbi:hypothetical protein F5Y15DRAFT_121208 [Xylariaceae sp. FL0016]|nr:hypothetical protein F5Y15DRAFT_121208 [Xylariaceae sp. FL0016]
MATPNPIMTNPFSISADSPSSQRQAKDEWEDWEEESDDESTHRATQGGLLVDISSATPAQLSKPTTARSNARTLQQRQSIQRPIRVKSKGRQKAQNAMAGIKVVTDMTQFPRPARPAQPVQPNHSEPAFDQNRGKFVDAAALLALEGKPSSPSIGSFAWLKRRPGNSKAKKSDKKATKDRRSDLSPDSRPIVIGLSVPEDDAGSHQVSPQTAVVETPIGMHSFSRNADSHNKQVTTPLQQQRSVWSPDTEASESPFRGVRAASSIYSQSSMYHQGPPGTANVPPVPALPATLKSRFIEQDDDDVGTPCTLFEEDGSPMAARKSHKPRVAIASPESASSRSKGWWDHITTPFSAQSNNPFKQQPQDTGSSSLSPQDWWSGSNEKKQAKSDTSGLTGPTNFNNNSNLSPSNSTAAPSGWWQGGDEKRAAPLGPPSLVVTTPAPLQQQHTVLTTDSSAEAADHNRPETHSEKAQILLEENGSRSPEDQPPPYEAPKTAPQVKYAAVHPPIHFSNERVPSPGPMTPGLPGTMTSQRTPNLSDIPLTPLGSRDAPGAVLPDRAPGSYATGDHFLGAPGRFNRSERERRRHEKEDVLARKAGGFWRGRGCMPAEGCFGRSGREGRKRRRICLAAFGGLLAVIILIVVLAVVLTRKSSVTGADPAAPSGAEQTSGVPVPSYWLNLTDFPPIPTGVLTVAGANNSVAISGCFKNSSTPHPASTAWSCAVPNGEHDDKSSFAANQPEFIFQIQYDNNTQALWKISNEDKSSSASDKRDFLADPGFMPVPEPPSVAEIRFLGNTTDHIVSATKEGEPTPFFISVLDSADATVGPNMLSRRQNNAIDGSGGNGTAAFNLSDILPAPALNGDGTGAPARLFPKPVQQPVRLFDRGLPSEHYGFYTHYDKDIYMANSTSFDPADDSGGVSVNDAKSLITFAQSRFLVQIWTRLPSSPLLNNGPVPEDGDAATAPGTMPYPVTVTLDMHGGNKNLKMDFSYGVMDNAQINRTDVSLVEVDRGFGGTLVNGLNDNPDDDLGGIDGGTGGCKCEWVNFQTADM